MKALYGARFVKYNVLWPICNVARRISCWSTADDRRLRRLVSYIHHTLDETLRSFIGDHADDLSVMLWVDASLAYDLRESKSTSGAYLAIVGPNTFAPIMSFAKKQTAVYHSSTESEIIALEEAVRTEGLPILTFWETVVAILSSQPAAVPAIGTARHSVPKQSFYRPLHSPAFQTHNRGCLVRGGVLAVPSFQLRVSSWK